VRKYKRRWKQSLIHLFQLSKDVAKLARKQTCKWSMEAFSTKSLNAFSLSGAKVHRSIDKVDQSRFGFSQPPTVFERSNL